MNWDWINYYYYKWTEIEYIFIIIVVVIIIQKKSTCIIAVVLTVLFYIIRAVGCPVYEVNQTSSRRNRCVFITYLPKLRFYMLCYVLAWGSLIFVYIIILVFM
jgi:hypothetical protein